MKKLLVVALTLSLMFTTFGQTILANETTETAEVYVTISDGNGDLVLTQEKVTVTDMDDDGVLTINDALYVAHEKKFEGGAVAGYASSMTSYGMSLDKLWGVANGGSYGYYLNHESPLSLLDVVKDGDYVNAYAFMDLDTWSDTYCFFDTNTVQTKVGQTVELTLNAYAYDENWNMMLVPVKDATITLNGVATEYQTDASGKVTVTLAEAGTCMISATTKTQTLVPPVCVVNVTGEVLKEDDTTQNNHPYIIFVVALIAIGCMAVILLRKGKTSYEK